MFKCVCVKQQLADEERDESNRTKVLWEAQVTFVVMTSVASREWESFHEIKQEINCHLVDSNQRK